MARRITKTILGSTMADEPAAKRVKKQTEQPYNGRMRTTELPSLTESLFGESGETSSALTDAIFGGAPAAVSNGDQPSSKSRFDEAVQQRIKSNLRKHAEEGSSNKDVNGGRSTSRASPSAPTRSSVDQILTRRRLQSALELVEPMTAMTPYGDESVDSTTEADELMKVPAEERCQEIARIVQLHGLAVVRNALPRNVMADLAQSATKIREEVCKRLDEKNICWRCDDPSASVDMFRFTEAASRCSGRMDVRYRTDETPFSDARIISNQSLMPIVNNLLGGNSSSSSDPSCLPRLLYAGLIFSFPGSDDQPFHQDGMPLFPEMLNTALPSYAINIFLPLNDEDGFIEAGPTEFIPGSHAMEADDVMKAIESLTEDNDSALRIVSPILKQGDALLYDYRVCHRGTSNLAGQVCSPSEHGRVRQILYLMYARPWFLEHMNFGENPLFDS